MLPLHQSRANCYDSGVPRLGFPMPNNGTAAQVATEKKLYRIGEVSRLADLKPFVLRYWETEFPILEPVKSPSGHRLYRQDDVDMVFRIKRLLYDEGFTIAGARGFRLGPEGNFERRIQGANLAREAPPCLLSRKFLLTFVDTLRPLLRL